MSDPEDRKYTPTHLWVLPEPSGDLLVGITDFAQNQLGDILFVQLPRVGQVLAAQESCAVVESVKSASDIQAPLAGVVSGVNAALCETPETLNTLPYDNWLFKLHPANPAEVAQLLTVEQYHAFME